MHDGKHPRLVTPDEFGKLVHCPGADALQQLGIVVHVLFVPALAEPRDGVAGEFVNARF